MADKNIEKLNAFIEKVDTMKKQNKLDLSSDQDLSIAIMNLVSIEEHFFFTGSKTGKNEYYDLINDVREMRKELLKKIITEYEGEVWCISKHLLAASMRLMEVGTKQLGSGKKEEAYDLFQKAYNLYSLFWGINMKLLNVSDLKKIDAEFLNKNEQIQALAAVNEKNTDLVENSATPKASSGFVGKLGELVKRAINCCIE